MMKNWNKPEAIGQEFAANEYVSACTIEIKCDFSTGESLHGGGLVVPADIKDFAGGEYRPCKHEFVVNVDELKQCTFTHFTEGPDDAPLSKSYPAYYWIQNEGGHDFHATSVSADQVAAANMS